MTNSADHVATPAPAAGEGRWAALWLIAYVALWPVPGVAEGVLTLGALHAAWQLGRARLRGAALPGQGTLRLAALLFLAWWLPQLLSAFDAPDPARTLRRVAAGLRYLPFVWMCAIAVSLPRVRRLTFTALAVIGALWTLDALAQLVLHASPLFWSLDQLKQLVSGHGFCSAAEVAAADRLSGALGPCNLKLGQTLASLSPFLLVAAARRSLPAWLLAAGAVGAVLVLAGSRASWITFALIVLLSGWPRLRLRGMVVALLAALVLAAGVVAVSPQARERAMRTALVFDTQAGGIDAALSGRAAIWSGALCMVRTHPVNGVGARGFRDAWPACDPQPERNAAWGEGPALHAHQIVLEILAETGVIGLLLWLAGAGVAWRAWRDADAAARAQARPAMIALLVTVFPLNTHLAFHSTFWGGLTLMLAGLYAGALRGRVERH